MILSKQNLEVVRVADVDKGNSLLANIHIAKDGSTVATNQKVFLAVSPVEDGIKKNVPLVDVTGGLEKDGCTIPAETIKEVLKNIPKDTKFGGLLEHTKLTNGGKRSVNFEITDGKRLRNIKGKKFPRKYIAYEKFLKDCLGDGVDGGGEKKIRTVVNLKRLLSLLNAVDKICPDSTGENPVFISFTSDNRIIVRAVNQKTGQRAVGFVFAFENEKDSWLDFNDWEKLNGGKRNAKVKRRCR